MKKTPLKRKTPMKRTGFKRKPAKKTPKKRDPKKTWRNKCDKMLTPIIKKIYPNCLFCGVDTQVAHHHFKKSTSNSCRYYIPNLIGLCTPCHLRLHHDEILWTGRVVEKKGLDWLSDLERQKKVAVKTNLSFYKENYKILEELYNSL